MNWSLATQDTRNSPVIIANRVNLTRLRITSQGISVRNLPEVLYKMNYFNVTVIYRLTQDIRAEKSEFE